MEKLGSGFIVSLLDYRIFSCFLYNSTGSAAPTLPQPRSGEPPKRLLSLIQDLDSIVSLLDYRIFSCFLYNSTGYRITGSAVPAIPQPRSGEQCCGSGSGIRCLLTLDPDPK
jgi:hypothetical protein